MTTIPLDGMDPTKWAIRFANQTRLVLTLSHSLSEIEHWPETKQEGHRSVPLKATVGVSELVLAFE